MARLMGGAASGDASSGQVEPKKAFSDKSGLCHPYGPTDWN